MSNCSLMSEVTFLFTYLYWMYEVTFMLCYVTLSTNTSACMKVAEIQFIIIITHGLLFCVAQDFFLMLLDADIAHKNTLFLHEPLFCVVPDVLLMWLHTDIVHTDILFFHE